MAAVLSLLHVLPLDSRCSVFTGWEGLRGTGGSITSARVIPDLHVNLQPFPCAMDLAVRLRESVVRAVCSKDYEHLPRLLRLLSKLNPTEEIMVGSGTFPDKMITDRRNCFKQ